MDEKEAGLFWDGNADAWTTLARAGYDVYRDYLNTPAFFAMLPDVAGLRGLDIGCGEGHNTRLLAERGARLVAIDISGTFLRHAAQRGKKGIVYCRAGAHNLPFPEASFDFATAFMSAMDVPDPDRLFHEARRVLKPGGFFQFSICHPCFDTPHRKNLRDAHGLAYAVEVGGYFRYLNGEISEWIFGAAPSSATFGLTLFRVPRFNRTLSQWLNSLVKAGFALERVEEPSATDEVVQACPDLQDTQVVPYFLHVRARTCIHAAKPQSDRAEPLASPAAIR